MCGIVTSHSHVSPHLLTRRFHAVPPIWLVWEGEKMKTEVGLYVDCVTGTLLLIAQCIRSLCEHIFFFFFYTGWLPASDCAIKVVSVHKWSAAIANGCRYELNELHFFSSISLSDIMCWQNNCSISFSECSLQNPRNPFDKHLFRCWATLDTQRCLHFV